jgi:ATP-dependent Clp protease adaptor protein ClpS
MMRMGRDWQANSSPEEGDEGEEGEGGTLVIRKEKVELPKKYKVLLHNDDYTTMEFVIMVLEKIFHKSLAEAQQIMLNIHNTGLGVCGIYTFEVAETKQLQVKRSAKENGHPLKCTIEAE